MGTRNVTTSGFFVRKKVKKHFISWLWSLVGKMFVREQVVDWQPVVACIRCHTQIEQRAAYCACCGVFQAEIVRQPDRETEAIQRLPVARQTEALQVETSEMRAVRLAREGTFLQRYLVEKKLYNWLYGQIEDWYQDWESLLAESKTHGFNQYPWLHVQLEQRGATGLIDEFGRRCDAEKVKPWQSTFVRELPNEGARNAARRRAN